MEAIAFGGIKARRGLVDDQQARRTEQGQRDAQAPEHAAGVRRGRSMRGLGQVDLVEQAFHFVTPRVHVGTAFQPREALQQVASGHARIGSDLLRQVTQAPPEMIRVRQHVHAVEADASGIGRLQGRERAHQAALARAVGAEQSIHPRLNMQVHAIEGAHSVAVGLGKALDFEATGSGHAYVPLTWIRRLESSRSECPLFPGDCVQAMARFPWETPLRSQMRILIICK